MREQSKVPLICGNRPELLLSDLDDPIENIGFELLNLFVISGLNDPIHLPKALPEFGVEMILHGIVASEWWKIYRPSSLVPMMAHLFPISLCSSTILC